MLAEHSPAPRPKLSRHWRQAGWPGALGVVLLVLMLLAFHQVMHWSVAQAQVRHAGVAAQAEALWRCRVSSGRLPCDAAALSGGPTLPAPVARLDVSNGP